MDNRLIHLGLLIIVVLVLLWSGINPYNRFTWFLEVIPVIIGIIILAIAYPRFQFTNLVYGMIAFHMIILMVGGHYTYARVPLFNWIRDIFEFSRNHYDRLGHFAQGFVPALIIREILLSISPLKRGKLLSFIIISICLAISASYELIEFLVSVLTGTAANDFLGTQGDVWDTQWDMTMALCGAITALAVLSRFHDRLLLARRPNNSSENYVTIPSPLT